jgi:uncharacterized protein with PIN domain
VTAERPKFVADCMLGSLARWLRMLGYDAVYAKDLEDDAIAELAEKENRHILTRDRTLAKRAGALMIMEDDLDSQLKAVHGRFALSLDEGAIRCSACNGPLAVIPKEDAAGTVPEGALESNEVFWKCAACGKVYWKGTHWLGIMDRLEKLNLA